jgi:hypothetical protein
MTTHTRIPITRDALRQRVARRLREQGQRLRRARGRVGPDTLGQYYITDWQAQTITADHVDLVALAQELGVLHPLEEVREEHENS